MAKHVIANGDAGLATKNGVNTNFTELYTGAEVVAATEKTTPADADVMAIQDSAASFGKKKTTWSDIKSTMKTYFDLIYVRTVAPTVVNAATYTVLSADRKIHVTYSATGTCVVTIPTALITDTFGIIIKDGGGSAETNNITIESEGSELFDGEANLVMSGNYDAVSIYSNGTNLFIY